MASALLAACAGAGSICTVLTENDAEGVAHRVGENLETSFAFTADTNGTQSEKSLFGLVGIAHPDVQVQLLRIGRVRPPRSKPAGSAGKPAGESQARNL